MNLSELRKLVRTKTRDNRAPFLASDAEIDANLNEAQREACSRACLIEDSISTTIDISPTDTQYDLDPRIIDVIDITITIGTSEPSEFTDGWTLTETKLILDRAPSSEATLTLHAYLLPSAEMISDTDEPEIRPVYHAQMAEWAISLFYLVQDADMFDQNAADRYADRFTRAFGERPNALTQRNRRSKVARTVTYNGYI